MKIVSKRVYNASPAELWQIIHEPGNMPAWNPKCVECDPVNGGGLGSRFKVVFEMSGKRKQARGEIIEFEPMERIRFRYHYEESSKMGSVDEAYAIAAKGPHQCHLRHETDFQKSTLPTWLKILIGLLGRFGKQVGRGPLDGIEELIAKGTASD